jgi:hypothetical protein
VPHEPIGGDPCHHVAGAVDRLPVVVAKCEGQGVDDLIRRGGAEVGDRSCADVSDIARTYKKLFVPPSHDGCYEWRQGTDDFTDLRINIMSGNRIIVLGEEDHACFINDGRLARR